ncbi:MAG TPA: LCP family protein, partial [Chloroflexota bacterium]
MRWVIRGLIGLLLIGAAWFSWQAYHVYQAVDSMTGQTAPRYKAEPTVVVPPLNGGKRVNFLVLGSDNDKKKEEARPLTQSMIIVTLDPLNYKVSMLSIPRDFWVKIPGHGMGKIDLAHKYGGVPLARFTVEKLLGIPIHHYAWVGLNGFIKVIDTFGGVTLNASYPILDDSYPNDLNSADPYGYKRVFIPP